MLPQPIEDVTHRGIRQGKYMVNEPLNCGTYDQCEPRDDLHPQDVEWYKTEALPILQNPPEQRRCGCNRLMPKDAEFKTCDVCRTRNKANYYRRLNAYQNLSTS